jgi:hypothetical protein
MRKQFYFVFIFVSLATLCFGQNPFTGKGKEIIVSDRKASEIDTIALVEPISLILGTTKERDAGLEVISRQNLVKGIDELFPLRIAIFDLDIDPEYLSLDKKVIFEIMKDYDDNKVKEADSLVNYIISTMEASHVNYILSVAQLGNSPRGETDFATPKISTEFGKSFESWSIIYCIIFDRQKKNVAFFGKSHFDHSEPCVKKNTDEQLMKLFKKYFKS